MRFARHLLSFPFAALAWLAWGDMLLADWVHGLAVEACAAIRGDRA